MTRRSVLFAVALAVMSLAGSAAPAGTLVLNDSGSLSGFTLTNLGISGGVTSLSLTLLDSGVPGAEHLETINGASVPNDANANANFAQPIMLSLTPLGGGTYSVSLSPPTYTKEFGTGGATAILAYNLTTAVAPTLLPKFLNLSGIVTSLIANSNPAYDFSQFAAGGSNNFTLTATSFTGGASDFASVISTVGASATGSGSFSEIAVPEPASFALLGIGISALVTFRRIFKRTALA